MSSFRSEPFLWIHLAGIAVFPVFLGFVWLGLAIAAPLSVTGLEFWLIASLGIVPILWMQLTRPFDIFSILLLSLEPRQLTLEQRRILAQFKTKLQQLLSFITAVLMLGVLWLLYRAVPLATFVDLWSGQWRMLGISLAAISFLASNLFIQVPVSVLAILLRSQEKIAMTTPLASETIAEGFTIPGFLVDRILPAKQSESK